jgi:hypothetical protein
VREARRDPNTGPFDAEVRARAVAAMFDKIGPAVLVTHSQGGGPGWLTVMKTANVRAVVSYEPGSGFVFPAGELPAPMSSLTGDRRTNSGMKTLHAIPPLVCPGRPPDFFATTSTAVASDG